MKAKTKIGSFFCQNLWSDPRQPRNFHFFFTSTLIKNCQFSSFYPCAQYTYVIVKIYIYVRTVSIVRLQCHAPLCWSLQRCCMGKCLPTTDTNLSAQRGHAQFERLARWCIYVVCTYISQATYISCISRPKERRGRGRTYLLRASIILYIYIYICIYLSWELVAVVQG